MNRDGPPLAPLAPHQPPPARDRASAARRAASKRYNASEKGRATKFRTSVCAAWRRAKIKEAINDPAYLKADHPKHKEVVDRAEALYELRWRD
jgi:hypothetical protein